MPPLPEPLMRASYIRSNLLALGDLEGDFEGQVRQSCGDVVQAVEDSVSVAWLPLELDARLTLAVRDVCGPQRLNEWSRQAIMRSGNGPLLRPILNALTRMGLTPHLILKRVSYAWKLVYRHCGEVDYEARGPVAAALVLRGAPEAMIDPVYLLGISGAFEGLMAIAGCPHGECAATVEEGVVRFACEWKPATNEPS